MHESQVKRTRDELFELRLRLALLEKKSCNPLYDKEIAQLKEEIVQTKRKMARQKTELYIEKGKKL